MGRPRPGPAATGARSGQSLAWLAAVAGFAFALLAFFPGYMSWDSAYQWWQARHGQFDSVHPPLMAMVWQAVDPLLPGPGGMLVLQQALLWSAHALFAAALPWRGWQRALLVLALGLWPPLLGVSAHIWKDVWTLAGFAWAAALLAHELQRPSRALRAAACLAIVAACAFRLNAITGALPLLAWIAWRECAAWPPASRGRGKGALLAGALVAGVALVSQLPTLDPRVRRVDSVWSVVTLWDAAGVSLREGRLVFPPELVAPGLAMDELREAFRDYSNTTVFETGKLRHSFDEPYSPAQRRALRELAWTLPAAYPRSYLAHRGRLAALLFGLDPAGLPDYLVLSPGLHAYGDNPALAPQRGGLHAWLLPKLQAMVDGPLFAGWLYLMSAFAVMVWAFRPRVGPAGRFAGALAMSSLAYALPLALVSGSAEFRYLAWPLLAAMLATVMAFAGTQKTAGA